MEIARFIYQDNPDYGVEFEPTGSDNVMVNATMMAAIFGKDLFQYTKSQQTKAFVDACLKPANAGLLGVKNKEDLIISKQKSGTWMHRIIALDFASWLDPDFKVWVYSTIDQILNHYYKEQRDVRLEKLMVKQKLASMKADLLVKIPEFAEYVRLEEEEQKATRKLTKIIKEQEDQLMLDFTTQVKPEQFS